jgi:uncharacterized protein (DUF427 family)
MKIPGPDHPISLAADGERFRASRANHILADSTDVIALRESTYPVVRYFSREDVETGFLSKTEKTTHCPYKGDASYYSIFLDGEVLENVVWSYEDPYPAMEQIRGRLAFYTDRIDVYPVTEAEMESRTSAV